ncbi:MAG: glucosaminidase domain-containing protein [Bacilli bacterium]|nr:glucosaminidase domain-containing protein [Bacilli bacterium]
MKKVGPALTSIVIGTLAIIVILTEGNGSLIQTTQSSKVTESNKMETKKEQKEVKQNTEVVQKVELAKVEEVVTPTPTPEPTPVPEPIVYDGLTENELGAKLNRSLNSTLSGYGSVFASQSLALGLDPYLALAIVLHETGCKWNCSTLLKECNNVGGMKGSPGCGGGSYKAFPTLEAGIRSYLDNLYNNYYRVGLTTPETIGPKYAESRTWVSNVQSYMSEIRAK